MGLIPGGRQELSEAISGMGEAANLENQQNIMQRNLDTMERARIMNMAGSGAGMALGVGPKLYKWASNFGNTGFNGTNVAQTSDLTNSGAITGNIDGTPASAITGDQFVPPVNFASTLSPDVAATAFPSYGLEGGTEAAAPFAAAPETGAMAGAAPEALASAGGDALLGAGAGAAGLAGLAGIDASLGAGATIGGAADIGGDAVAMLFAL